MSLDSQWTRVLALVLLCCSIVCAGSPPPDANPLDVVQRYLSAGHREDAVGAVRELSPEQLASRGGFAAVVEQKQKIYRVQKLGAPKPRMIQLGEPMSFNAGAMIFSWVPLRVVTDGFPKDITTTSMLGVVSSDEGKTWRVLDASCADEDWIKRFLPGYPFDQQAAQFSVPKRTLEWSPGSVTPSITETEQSSLL